MAIFYFAVSLSSPVTRLSSRAHKCDRYRRLDTPTGSTTDVWADKTVCSEDFSGKKLAALRVYCCTRSCWCFSTFSIVFRHALFPNQLRPQPASFFLCAHVVYVCLMFCTLLKHPSRGCSERSVFSDSIRICICPVLAFIYIPRYTLIHILVHSVMLKYIYIVLVCIGASQVPLLFDFFVFDVFAVVFTDPALSVDVFLSLACFRIPPMSWTAHLKNIFRYYSSADESMNRGEEGVNFCDHGPSRKLGSELGVPRNKDQTREQKKKG